jgi:ADP-ribose pyrophosphatase
MEGRFVMKVLRTRRVYDGKVLRLRVDDVVYPNGHESKIEVVEHDGGVSIVARPDPASIVLVKQYRPAIGRDLWEVPAGKLERDEDPHAAAVRELQEETGYRCASMRKLWTFYTAPGFCGELLHLYAAEGLTPGEPHPEEDESLDVRTFAIDEAWSMVLRDEIPDAKTQIALAWARGAGR